MRNDQIKYALARGNPITYESNQKAIRIYQPTIQEIEEVLINYDGYKYVHSASKENLEYSDGESIDDYEGLSYFQTLFKLNNKIYLNTLLLSLTFFLKVKIDNIRVYLNDMKLVIVNDDGIELFILDDGNFEEFGEFIRLICCCEKIKDEEDSEDILKINPNHSQNPETQRIYEQLINQHNKSQRKKKKENSFTQADMIGSICINEKTKYKFEDIDKLTIWQLYFIYNGMFVREGNEFAKMQYCSYKFVIEDKPDFNWVKETKITLPVDMFKKLENPNNLNN